MTISFRRLCPLLLLIFIDSFSYFVVIPVLLRLFYGHHASILSPGTTMTTRDVLTGVTIALSPLAALLSAPFIGNASDHYGRKKTLLGCLCCVLIGFVLPIMGIVKKSVALILLGRFVAGVGSASQPVAQAVVADLCQEKDKAWMLSNIALMMTLALIVGPLAGGYLSDVHLSHVLSLTTPYLFASILSVLNILLLLFFFQETLQPKTSAYLLSVREVATRLPHYIKRYGFGCLLIVFFLLELGWSQYYQSISLLLHVHWHYSARDISLFNAYLGMVMSVGLLILYPILLRFFSIKMVMRWSVFFVTAGFVGCVLLKPMVLHWLCAGIVAIFTGTAYVSLVALISNQTAKTHQGLVMGFLSTLLFFAWMLTAFDAGFLIAYHAMLPLYLSLLFLVIAVIFTFQKGMSCETTV